MRRDSVLTVGLLGTVGSLVLVAAAQPVPTQPTSQPAPGATEPAAATPTAAPAPRSLFDLKEFTLNLGFEGSYDQRRVAFETNDPFRLTQRQTNRSRVFEETLGLHTVGAVLDEKIAQFDIAARYGLAQQWYRETGSGRNQTENPNGDILEYDLNLTLLPRGKVSGNVFAQKLDSRVPRAFLPSLDRTLERYGGGVFLNDATFPMKFTFEHVWDELTSRTRDLNDDEQRGNNTFRYEGTWQISPQQSLRLDYEYTDRHERYSGTKTRFDTTRHYLTLEHVLRFGPDGKSSWETLARYQDESGDLARDNTELSTRLRLQLTDALSGNVAAQFLRDTFSDLSTDTWRGEGGLTHQLGETLTTTVQAYTLKQNANERPDFREWGGLLSTSFSHENSLGRFSTNVAYNHTATDSDSDTQRGIVIGESVTFRDPLPTYLVHLDVDPVSILVTDATRSRTYLPGRDYTALRVGHYTALTRVPTGNIADRQGVLVSYTYKVPADYKVARERFDVRIQQDFKFGLTPYYAGSLQSEDIDSARRSPFRERNVNRQRLGATYRQKRWSVGLEYEYNDDSIDPYSAVHGNGDAVLWQKANHQLDATATLSRFWFTGAEEVSARDTTLVDLGATYRYLLAQNLEANASVMYRFEDDSLNGRTNGVDLTAAIDWKLGYFALRFEAEYDRLDLRGSQDQSCSFWVKLRRDIPLIARGEPW
jgi:hypothetical protein